MSCFFVGTKYPAFSFALVVSTHWILKACYNRQINYPQMLILDSSEKFTHSNSARE